MKYLYMVAIQGPHGPSPINGDIYQNYKKAEAKLQRDKEAGIDYTRIFTLRIVDAE